MPKPSNVFALANVLRRKPATSTKAAEALDSAAQRLSAAEAGYAKAALADFEGVSGLSLDLAIQEIAAARGEHERLRVVHGAAVRAEAAEASKAVKAANDKADAAVRHAYEDAAECAGDVEEAITVLVRASKVFYAANAKAAQLASVNPRARADLVASLPSFLALEDELCRQLGDDGPHIPGANAMKRAMGVQHILPLTTRCKALADAVANGLGFSK